MVLCSALHALHGCMHASKLYNLYTPHCTSGRLIVKLIMYRTGMCVASAFIAQWESVALVCFLY